LSNTKDCLFEFNVGTKAQIFSRKGAKAQKGHVFDDTDLTDQDIRSSAGHRIVKHAVRQAQRELSQRRKSAEGIDF